MVVVVEEVLEEEVEIKNSLMVWALSIEINALPKKNGQICPVGKDVRCNR